MWVFPHPYSIHSLPFIAQGTPRAVGPVGLRFRQRYLALNCDSSDNSTDRTLGVRVDWLAASMEFFVSPRGFFETQKSWWKITSFWGKEPNTSWFREGSSWWIFQNRNLFSSLDCSISTCFFLQEMVSSRQFIRPQKWCLNGNTSNMTIKGM